jgi:hypothetical protein
MSTLDNPLDINNNPLKVGDYVTCKSYGKNIPEEGYIKSFRKGKSDNHIYVNVDNIHGTGSWSRVTNTCRKKDPPAASVAEHSPAPAPRLPQNTTIIRPPREPSAPAPAAASAAAGTPPHAPAPLQKIKVPMPNPINALLGPNKKRPSVLLNANREKELRNIRGQPQITELKSTGPPYYFRITRNTFSAIYRSNQLPKAGETIPAQALQVEGGPFWIGADIPVTIPSIDEPLSGTIDMIVCEVPTMKGGRRTRRRRRQRKQRKTRRA